MKNTDLVLEGLQKPIWKHSFSIAGSTPQIIISICPIAKPRMTRRDVWLKPPRPAVAKYRYFRNAMNVWKINHKNHYDTAKEWILAGAKITFYLPIAKSTPEKKADYLIEEPARTVKRNDLDNLEKAFYDCFLPEDDSMVWQHWTIKLWGYRGFILIEPLKKEKQND